MNYYIQGCAAKADKIKAAFERLGYDTSFVQKLSASDSHILFTLPCDTRVHAFHTAYIEADILKRLVNIDPDYKELELPAQPNFKVGDWIACIDDEGDVAIKKIVCFVHNKVLLVDVDGCFTEYPKTELSNFHLWSIADAKDGDVLAFDWTQDDGASHWEKIVIFKKYHAKGVKGVLNSPCVEGYGNTFKNGKLVLQEEVPYYSKTWTMTLQPATREQRDLLFAKMLESGYEWDAEKKGLRKIFEPKFKVGDDIKTGSTIETIAEIDYTTRSYSCESGRTIWFENQDMWYLAPKPHYDIKNFHAGMPVLVRDGECDDDDWTYALFSHYNSNRSEYKFSASGDVFRQCIPFEGNEALLGTTDMCSEEYINW